MPEIYGVIGTHRFLQKDIYSSGDIVVITNDERKLGEYWSNARKHWAGQICVISEARTDKYITQHSPLFGDVCSGYFLQHSIILGVWDGEYIPAKKRYCAWCSTSFVYSAEEPFLCPECAKRNFVLPYHRYQPKLSFYGKTYGNKNPYLGVEVEVDEGGEEGETVTEIMPIMNKENGKFFIYCSHDGSLNDGFEIITQPATLKYHLGIMNSYKELFKNLINKGYQSHNTSTCGVHVHFNRDFYKENETLYITRLLYIVEKFWDDIVIFSRRNQRRIDRYSKKMDCKADEYIKKWNKSENHDAHYYAINLANENTIEFRMFRGTLNANSFQAILEFVNNCIKIAKNSTTEEIQRMEFKDILTPFSKKYYNSRIATKIFDE